MPTPTLSDFSADNLDELVNSLNQQKREIEYLLNFIDADNLASGGVGSDNLADGAVTNPKLNRTSVDRIVIGTADIEDAAITSAKIELLSVNTGHIVNAAIETAKIQDAAVVTAKIHDLAVTNGKIDNLAVGTAKIQDLAVTNGKIDNLAVDTAKIKDASITNAKIADLAVDDAKIQRLSAGKITVGPATIFDTNYDPSTKETPAGAQAKADSAESAAETYTDNQLTNYVKAVEYNQEIDSLQSQIDGNITNWFSDGQPTLTNYPASDWTDTATKNQHLGDIYYDNQTGYSYRFQQTADGTSYQWVMIQDSDIQKALQDAAQAQDTADQKRRVFVSTPTPPYDVGDLWDSPDGIKRCVNAKVNGQVYASNDFILASDITGNNTAADTSAVGGVASGTVAGWLYPNTTFINGGMIGTGTITANQMEVGTITANSGIIADAAIDTAQLADGSITDAKIVSLTADKINAGTLDTGLVTIQGTNGHLAINNNRLQIFDAQATPVERVSVGDVNGDGTRYGLLVRGADGTTVLYDENGVYEAGITDGAVTNPKIGSGAVKNENIYGATITGDRLVVDAITAREIAAKSVSANEMVVGTITAASGIIADAAITTAAIANAAITTAKINDLAVTNAKIDSLDGGKITANTITADKLIVGNTTNLCPEPTFTAGGAEWYANVTAVNGGSGAPTDMVGKQTGRDGYGSDYFPVNPGDVFYVSAMAYTPDSTHAWGIGLEFTSRDGTTHNWPVQRIGPTGTWTKVEGFVTNDAANDFYKGRVFTQINSFDTYGTWYFTNVVVRPAVDNALVVNGAITADKLNVTSLSAISADLGTVTAGSLTSNTTIDVGTDLKVGSNIYVDYDEITSYRHLYFGKSNAMQFYVNPDGIPSLTLGIDIATMVIGGGSITLGTSTQLSGRLTTDEGVIVGQNNFIGRYNTFDGLNDLMVAGQFEASGGGGASMYKLGIGTAPPGGEGDLLVGGQTTLRPQVGVPWGLYMDMSWNDPATTAMIIEMDGDGTDDLFFDLRSAADGNTVTASDWQYKLYSNGEIHTKGYVYSEVGGVQGRFYYNSNSYLKLYDDGTVNGQGAQIWVNGAAKQTWTSLPKSRLDPDEGIYNRRSFGVNNPGSMQPLLMDMVTVEGNTRVDLDDRFRDFVGGYQVFVNNGKVVNQQYDYFDVEGEGPIACMIVGIQAGKEDVHGYHMIHQDDLEAFDSLNGVLPTRRKTKGQALRLI